MKKFLIAIFALILGGNLISSVSKINTFAESNIVYIDEAIEINNDTTYSGKEFVVSATTNLAKSFDITSGVLTLENCKISASSTGVMETIFDIGSNAKLILNNVTFENINYTSCINNEGIVDIIDTNFITGRTSIENNSTKTNSFNYYSGALANVILNSGYISVYENTVVESNISISIGTFADMTLAVKGIGNNVFASKYIDKFTYKDNPNTSLDHGYYLDYIGDFDSSTTTITDASGNIQLQSGDIVLTTMNISFTDRDSGDTVTYAPKYCTSYNYLKSNSSTALYKSNGLARTLDNFSANTNESAKFSKIADNNIINLNINCIAYDGETEIVKSTSQTIYLAGSNHAVFVDIPEDYEFDSTNEDSVIFMKGSATTDILTVSEFYSNEYYMRPIIVYNSATYNSNTITANFYFKKKVKYAKVDMIDNYGVALDSHENMVVGEPYQFVLTCAEDEIIDSATFNGESVILTEVAKGYSFTAVVEENNTVITNIKHIINVTPNPSKLSFVYGDTIELKETYKVDKTNDSIVIEYNYSGTDVGQYDITSVKSCSSENYIINVTGQVKYVITQKGVDLNTIQTKVYQVQYSKDLVLTYDKFLVNPVPEYLEITLQNTTDYSRGEQTLRLNVVVKDDNYVIVNDDSYIYVTLDIIPLEIDVSTFVLADDTKEYTGSKIELTASGYDDSIVNVKCEYYISSDLVNPVDAINVGEYVVKLVVTAKSNVYSITGSKAANLTITSKAIDLDNYINSIAVNESNYDGSEKYIDLKVDTLPDYIAIDRIESEEKQKFVGTYYYDVYFKTTSNNYSCVESARVALVINPKVVTLTLATSVFDYTGNVPNLVVNISDIVVGDVVTAVFETIPVSTVGTHKIKVIRLSNENYTITSPVELQYVINSISVDMSGIEFNNISTTYDGQLHKPVLTGTLPLGITNDYSVVDSEDDPYACINAGTYNVKCTFYSSNAGIIAPSPIYAVVTIEKRELLIVYSEPSNMIANGERKNIGVEIIGGVAGLDVPYELSYSSDPILAGEYTCRVKLLDEINYTLKSDAPYRFIIFMSSINYNEDGINLNVTGKFSSQENLMVSKVSNKVDIVNLVSKLNVKNYVALDLSCVNYSDELMTISIDSKDFAEHIKYFNVYRVKNNKLEEVEYIISGNIISFKSNCNEEIVFVEQHNYMYRHRAVIYTIIVLAVVSLGLIVSIAIVDIVSRKKYLKVK